MTKLNKKKSVQIQVHLNGDQHKKIEKFNTDSKIRHQMPTTSAAKHATPFKQ